MCTVLYIFKREAKLPQVTHLNTKHISAEKMAEVRLGMMLDFSGYQKSMR